MNEALGKEQVVQAGGIDLRDTEWIPVDRNLRLQAGHLDLPIHLRERAPGGDDAQHRGEQHKQQQRTAKADQRSANFFRHIASIDKLDW
jgi:hypothetical protein